MSHTPIIRPVAETDAATITRIYNHYITSTTVSFETEPLTVHDMLQRIKDISSSFPYLVAEEEGRVVGYCYVHLWKARAAYSHTLEFTIYLDPDHKGRGTGTRLARHVIDSCRTNKTCKNIIACITGENQESLAFHSSLGFEKVSHFKGVGYKQGRWLDVIDMQLTII